MINIMIIIYTVSFKPFQLTDNLAEVERIFEVTMLESGDLSVQAGGFKSPAVVTPLACTNHPRPSLHRSPTTLIPHHDKNLY